LLNAISHFTSALVIIPRRSDIWDTVCIVIIVIERIYAIIYHKKEACNMIEKVEFDFVKNCVFIAAMDAGRIAV